MSMPPTIPESAPFTLAQRFWLNGYLAALNSGSTSAIPESTPGIPITILWGSQSGNAEGLAEQFGDKLQQSGFNSLVVDMAEHASVDLAKTEHLLVISSTWGEGDPPDNAVEFWKMLSAEDAPALPNLNYAVLGLGDSNYLDFCAIGRMFDARLEALGAKRIADRGDCDVDFEDVADTWIGQVLKALDSKAPTATKEPEAPVTPAIAAWSKKNPFPGILTVNRRLNAAESPRDTRHFEIALGESGLEYEAGDVLGVFPDNCPGVVEDVLQILGLDGEEAVPDPDGNVVAVRRALGELYSITTPSRKFLKAFAERSGSDFLQQLLQPESKKELGEYLWGREMIDLLVEFPNHGLNATEFVSMLGKLTPRLYSIASSPKAHPGEVHLTVARVSYESHGRARKGVASTWLSDRVGEGGGIPLFFQQAKHFKLPVTPTTPIIMVGPGTGIAPFRAFLEERQVTGAPGGNWLLFGNPHQKTDFLYEDQLTAMKSGGSLTRLDLAWSRDQAEKIYVQHLLLKQAPELWRWIDEGAHLYVCGDAKYMAKDVDAALHQVIAEQGGLGADGATEYVAKMKNDKRYQRDVY